MLDRKRHSRMATFLAVLAVLVTTLVATPFIASGPASAVAPAPDGATSFTAAASCWEIKQAYPASADGVYWLVTPTLQAPQQFYCDMTTDGGGWVLVGRGREGWRMNYEGYGTPAQVRDVVNGPGAFLPRQLSSLTIDGLLDGGRVDAMVDPIRLRRATDTAGTTWQEARFRMAKRDRWVWSFGAEHPVGAWSFGPLSGDSGTGGQTNSFGNNSALRRVEVRNNSAQAFTYGWAFGSSTTGTNSATSYLWSATSGGGSARPFTQVFIRPRLTLASLSFPAIPNSGTPAETLRPVLANGALPQQWGVTGRANGGSPGNELYIEVAALEQIGSRVYVGGNFRYVQRGAAATGADKVEQPYLAAFDLAGNWIPGFRPTLNNQVKSLAGLPDGTLMVGGDFTQANGAPAVGAVRLDATTGATAPGWQLGIEDRIQGETVTIRDLDVQGGWLYLGGRLTHIKGGTATNPVYAKMMARVSVSTGIPDGGWNPVLNGMVASLDASADGTRVYGAGFFTQAGSTSALKAVVLNTTNGAVAQPWSPVWSANANYQQAILEVGNRVWSGGSEHSLFSFDRSSLQRLSGNITMFNGDFQSIGTTQGVVYGTCHCPDWNYENAFTWPSVGTSWTQADKSGWIIAVDNTTGKTVPDFDPVMTMEHGQGPWATLVDSNGNAWFGGDVSSALMANGASEWLGGFVRFAPRDAVAPSAPSGLKIDAANASNMTISWNAATGGPLSYEVIVENKVVATTTQTSLTMPTPAAGQRLFVRAIDTTGNRSASTPALTPPTPGSTVDLVVAGSTWRWQYVNAAWPAGWTTVGFNDAAWNQGPAPLGFGSSGLGTNIDVPAPTSNRPLSAQFRRQFQVPDPSAITGLTLTTRADDGVVVYVNGTEVGRANMPSGTLTSGSYPTAAPRTSTATANLVTFAVPPSLLVSGTNVVTASTHLNYRATPDVSFELTLRGNV